MKRVWAAALIGAILLVGCGGNPPAEGDTTTTIGGDVTTTTANVSDETTVVTTTGTTKPSGQAQNQTNSKATTTTTEFVLQSTVTTFKRINPERSAKETAQLMNNKLSSPATKMPSEKALIWYPQNENDWKMSQHASVGVLNGKVYVTWSMDREHEDGCGQRIMYSYSSDFKNWSKPKVVPFGETEIGQYYEVVKMNGWMHTYNGRLYLRFSSSEWRPEDMQGPNLRPYSDAPRINYKIITVSTADGVNWREEKDIAVIPNNLPSMVTNRHFTVGGNGLISFTDDPSGLTGWDSGAVSGFDAAMKEYGYTFMGEATSYQTADGIVRAMWRADGDYMVMAESYNNGLTFTRPYVTNITNGWSKFVFGYLPDKRIFCIYNPTGKDRLPLSIALSEDGINFNKEYIIRDEPIEKKYSGIGKGGHYSYPSYCIDNGYIYITYVLQKEGVEITRIKISDLK